MWRWLLAWGGCGFVPLAPGTIGTIGALPVAWAIVALGGTYFWLWPAALLATIVGWYGTARYLAQGGDHDPGWIVIDEVAGVWLTLAIAGSLIARPLDTPTAHALLFAAGFVAFRFFDIVKPYPISVIDRQMVSAFGVMADDLLAGVFAAAAVLLVFGVLSSLS